MLNSLVMWMCANPLEFVTGAAVLVAVLAATLIPGLQDVQKCGHPRC